MDEEYLMGFLYFFTGGLFGIGWIIDSYKIIAEEFAKLKGRDIDKSTVEEKLHIEDTEDLDDIEDYEDEEQYDENFNIYKSNSIGFYTSDGFTYHHDNIELVGIDDMKKDYTILNFEATGLDSEVDKIIQISAFRYRDNIKVNEFVSFVNPEMMLPESITSYTGITDSDVRYAPKIDSIIKNLIAFIGNDVIVEHC